MEHQGSRRVGPVEGNMPNRRGFVLVPWLFIGAAIYTVAAFWTMIHEMGTGKFWWE